MTKIYICPKHNFEATGLMAVQLHMDANYGCELGVRRPRCKAITFAGQPDHLLVRCSLEEGHTERGEPHHRPSWSEADANH